jgi:hypothetical protein
MSAYRSPQATSPWAASRPTIPSQARKLVAAPGLPLPIVPPSSSFRSRSPIRPLHSAAGGRTIDASLSALLSDLFSTVIEELTPSESSGDSYDEPEPMPPRHRSRSPAPATPRAEKGKEPPPFRYAGPTPAKSGGPPPDEPLPTAPTFTGFEAKAARSDVDLSVPRGFAVGLVRLPSGGGAGQSAGRRTRKT